MTNRLILVVALWATGCKQQRDVYIQMGPQPGRVSDGFKCEVDDPASKAPLLGDAIIGGVAKVSLVIDLVDLGDRLPGCRAEDLFRACISPGACTLLETGSTRYCSDLEIPINLLTNDALMIAEVKRQLSDGDALRVTANTPDRPMLVRATLTRQPCAEVQDGRTALDVDDAVGCAYSCPFVADTIVGSIDVGLDTFTKKCRPAVRACAGFPALP